MTKRRRGLRLFCWGYLHVRLWSKYLSRYINHTLAALTLVALLGMFSTSGEPVIWLLRDTPVEAPLIALGWPNTILFNLSLGYLVTVFFWLLVVYIPESARRNLLRENLSRRYQDFKEEVIQSLLWASIGTHDSKLPKQLADDHHKFRAFFDEDKKRHWYAALNGMQGNEDRMRELTLALEMLSDEVAYVLNNVPIQDQSVHRFFKNLNENVYRLQHLDADTYDQVKHVGGFLWGMLARWNFVDGQLETDVVQEMINRL